MLIQKILTTKLPSLPPLVRKSKIVTVSKELVPEIFKFYRIEDNLVVYLEEDRGEEVEKFFTEQLSKKILKKIKVSRGDVIYFDWIPKSENDGKVLWDGNRILLLNYYIDLDGSVPENFTFPEFPLDYFYDSVCCNQIIWLSKRSIEEAISNFDEVKQSSFIIDYSKKSYVVKFDKNMTKEEFRKEILEKPYVGKLLSEGVYQLGGYHKKIL